MELGPGTAVHAACAALPRGRWLLAVSGGRDSMVLLHAMARARGAEVAAVANFDHGTGAFARRAALLVAAESARLSLPFVAGVALTAESATEAVWRAARHAFLDSLARELDATVVTAHTRDDQIETVLQRLLRDAGPRGLAAMRATPLPGRLCELARRRPLIAVSRSTIAAFAHDHTVTFIEDPSNRTLAFQRNRVRHELLPALEAAVPGFGEWCWSLGERAADWRKALERFADTLGVTAPGTASEPNRVTLIVPAAPLADCGPDEWGVLWPALAARVGVVMDRRGIERASSWAPRARAGQAIPLAGDATIARTSATFVVRGTL